jgi:uncharacterized protein
MVAGGATGMVTMADDLGGDDCLVAFMQYLRVLLVVILTPVLTAVAFPGHHGAGSPAGTHTPALGDVGDWLLTLAIASAGALVASRARLPAAALLGPMILSAVLTLSLPDGTFTVPPALRELSFAVIGLQVGLRFTAATLREVGRLLAPVALGLLGLLVACFGLAVALELTTSVSLLDAYLATTPRRSVRRAGARLRSGRQHHLHHRGPGPAGPRDGPARPDRGASPVQSGATRGVTRCLAR